MSTKSHEAPFRIGVAHGVKKGLIPLDQVGADKVRLVRKLGDVPPKTLTATLSALQEVFTR